MKKNLLIIIIFILMSLSALAHSGNLTIGVLGVRRNSLHKVESDVPKFQVAPYVKFEKTTDHISLVGSTITFVDYEFLGNHGLGAYINFYDGFPILKRDMKIGYKSIESRDSQIAFGAKLELYALAIGLRITPHVQIARRGNKAGVLLETLLQVNEDFRIIPAISLDYYTKSYTDYYFGVRSSEIANEIKHVYNPNSAFVLGTNFIGEYNLIGNFSLLGIAGIEFFPSSISSSPITNSSYRLSVGIGGTLKF